MTRKTGTHRHGGDNARFHVYYERGDEMLEFVNLELGGTSSEEESSRYLSRSGRGNLVFRIPVKWTRDLILGFQKALVDAFIPLEIRERARDVFDNEDAALTWLIAKTIVFGGKSAVDLCLEGKTDVVMHALGIIDGETWA